MMIIPPPGQSPARAPFYEEHLRDRFGGLDWNHDSATPPDSCSWSSSSSSSAATTATHRPPVGLERFGRELELELAAELDPWGYAVEAGGGSACLGALLGALRRERPAIARGEGPAALRRWLEEFGRRRALVGSAWAKERAALLRETERPLRRSLPTPAGGGEADAEEEDARSRAALAYRQRRRFQAVDAMKKEAESELIQVEYRASFIGTAGRGRVRRSWTQVGKGGLVTRGLRALAE